jgi:diaminopimelate decarboxylase
MRSEADPQEDKILVQLMHSSTPVAYNAPVRPTYAELIERFGSPLYVYDADEVRRAFVAFRGAFTYRPLDIFYATVCNKNPYLIRVLHELGAGIHANTPGDAYAALRLGLPEDCIAYSGTNLSRADFDFFAGRGIAMNLDSLDQLRDFCRYRVGASVGLRLLIDPESSSSRIGVTPSELKEALEMTREGGVRLSGLHMYAGTNSRKASRFLNCFERVLQASDELPDLEYLDLGGGFGLDYYETQEPLDLAAMGREICSVMEGLSAHRGRRIRLAVEPGRFLVARAGSLLMTVVSVKERAGRRFVGVDTTVGNIVVESVYHRYHRLHAVAARGDVVDVPTDVCGNTTHSRDFIARSCKLPEVRAGDLLRLEDVGAYGYAMSSHFLNRPRPAEVVQDGAEVHLTTRRESFADLVATCTF